MERAMPASWPLRWGFEVADELEVISRGSVCIRVSTAIGADTVFYAAGLGNVVISGCLPRLHRNGHCSHEALSIWPRAAMPSWTVPPGQRLPALVWKIHLLHGAQARLIQNAAITGDAPRTLSRLRTERIQGQCAALLKITQEIPVSLQSCHGGQRGEPGRGGPRHPAAPVRRDTATGGRE
jgi:hypothetical protein